MSDTKNSEHEKDTTSWRDKTVKASGYAYLLGDAAMAMSGHIKNKEGILKAGAIWSAGGIGAAVYGNPDVDKQLDILAHKLEKHLTKHGATVTDAVRENTELLKGQNGLGAKLDRFMHEHPTELLNAAYAIGSVFLLRGGIKKFSIPKDATGKIETAMGALVLSGALCGLLIKEDPDARAKADNSSIVSKTAAWVKEKPMRLAGGFYWANNGVGIYNAITDKKQFADKPKWGMKAHWFSLLTVASYIAANGLLFASSRDQIQEKKFKSEDIAKLEQVAAEIIAAQPPQLQAALLTDVSQYLAKERMINVSAEELTKQLVARVGEASQQHLAQATTASWASRASANEQAAPSVA